jgi:hypothetical protein
MYRSLGERHQIYVWAFFGIAIAVHDKRNDNEYPTILNSTCIWLLSTSE